MSPWQDEAGNLWGRYDADTETQEQFTKDEMPVLLLGSHLDTVANAGRYDGILGVLSAIEIIEHFNENDIRFPFAIEVVAFADEEGARFGSTLLGSRAVAGTWSEDWFSLQDSNGISLAQAFKDFGLAPEHVYQADRSRNKLLAYIELHIEQGPVLEENNLPVGVVSSIAGARRFTLVFEGDAGHAGTVPMSMRHDPLVAAAGAIERIENVAKLNQIVATVGKIKCYPDAINIIPGRCELSLDIRSGVDRTRDVSVDQIFSSIESICEGREVEFSFKEIHNAPAVSCASWIQRFMEDVVQSHQVRPISLVSGAGHDAMAFNGVTEIGMLFLRCAGGVSHNPEESVTLDDVNSGLNIFSDTVIKFAQIYSENLPVS